VEDNPKIKSVENIGRVLIKELQKKVGRGDENMGYVLWGDTPEEIRDSLEDLIEALEEEEGEEIADLVRQNTNAILMGPTFKAHNVVVVFIKRKAGSLELYATSVRANLTQGMRA